MTRFDLIVVTFHIMLVLLALLLLQLEVGAACCGWCTLTLVGPDANGVHLLDSLHFCCCRTVRRPECFCATFIDWICDLPPVCFDKIVRV